MAIQAAGCRVRTSGSSTAFSGEAMSLVDGLRYRIADAGKSVWDWEELPTIYDGATPVAVAAIDYLAGEVVLEAAPSGAVTADGQYLPLLTAALAREFSISGTRSLLDRTAFHDTDRHRKRQAGLLDLSGSIGQITPEGGGPGLGEGPVVLEFRIGAEGPTWRVLALLEEEATAGDLEDLVNDSIEWELAGALDPEGRPASLAIIP